MAHEMLGRCPVCGEALEVARLHCPHCDTSVEGRFALGRFAALSREQVQFLEAFLRARGVIKEVEEALGISYPTVRGRLDDLLRALGFTEEREQQEREREQRRGVLADLSAGRISAEDAMRRLAPPGSGGE